LPLCGLFLFKKARNRNGDRKTSFPEKAAVSQSLSRILVHVIFSTKDRIPFLADAELRKKMHAYLAGAFNQIGSPAIEVGGAEDHVHILCLLSRNHSISEIIRRVKANSSSWAKTKKGRCLKFSWQSGYGSFSVDPSQSGSLQEYIRGQEEHHRKRTFQEEYREFLNQFHVDYDERYVWL
jgi:putative transposase